MSFLIFRGAFLMLDAFLVLIYPRKQLKHRLRQGWISAAAFLLIAGVSVSSYSGQL